mmetsp:Transcript_10217/g.22491  ORF Transcript_10217/g.22491 Transcript_10217/m.22491 type:complete len:180 (-) Transcript_10217:5-544(-)
MAAMDSLVSASPLARRSVAESRRDALRRQGSKLLAAGTPRGQTTNREMPVCAPAVNSARLMPRGHSSHSLSDGVDGDDSLDSLLAATTRQQQQQQTLHPASVEEAGFLGDRAQASMTMSASVGLHNFQSRDGGAGPVVLATTLSNSVAAASAYSSASAWRSRKQADAAPGVCNAHRLAL